MDIGMSLLHLSVGFLILHSKQTGTWNVQL